MAAPKGHDGGALALEKETQVRCHANVMAWPAAVDSHAKKRTVQSQRTTILYSRTGHLAASELSQ